MHYGNLKGGQHLLPTNIKCKPVLFGEAPKDSLVMVGDNFFVKGDGNGCRCASAGDEEVYDRGALYFFGESVPVLLVELESEACGCCECYHPQGYAGECRDNRYQFPTNAPGEWFDGYIYTTVTREAVESLRQQLSLLHDNLPRMTTASEFTMKALCDLSGAVIHLPLRKR